MSKLYHKAFEGKPVDIEKQSIKNIYEAKGLSVVTSHNSLSDLPYENIFNIFDDHNVELGYVYGDQINGRPVPHATIIDALDTNDGKLVRSLDTDFDLNDLIDNTIALIDEHYRYYGAMLNQKVFSDVRGFEHLQSALLVRSYVKPRPPFYTPIMGVNALNIAITRIRSQRNAIYSVGNVLSPKKQDKEDGMVFTYEYLGYSPFNYDPHVLGIRDVHDREATFLDEFLAFGVLMKLDCWVRGKHPDFPSSLSEKPFRLIGEGYQNIPTNWSVILLNYYLNISEFSRSILACVKYKDIFLFWLAASSGLPLTCFQSFENDVSEYHNLPKSIKRRVIRDMMPLVENASLKMQSNEYLAQTPLINLYEAK